MKKLIAMIGAAAMAFGLYADATPFATSFEAADGVTEATYTPGEGWTWQGDPLTVGVYAGDKYDGYAESGALARRNGSFLDNANDQYLKLETGTNALTRVVGEGNVFLDQLVKFTGFEEYQTNVVAGTKIAVWMSGIETEGTPQIGTPQIGTPQIGTPAQGVEGEEGYVPASPDYQPASPDYQPASPDYQPASDDYIAGETNLYVTVGKIDDDGNITPVKIKIDGEYKLDTWYRLTIKSLGSIFQFSNHAGFIIYVDGQQVSSSDPDATLLVANDSDMTPTAKGYMADGALFTAIDNTDATFATVGYQGIGAIDDIILDEGGPAFAQAIDVLIEFPVDTDGNPSVEVDYIDVGGVHMTYPCAVPAGTLITVYFKAVDGKKIMTDLQPQQLTVTANNFTIDVSDVEVEDVVAKKNVTIDLAASEIADALAALVENDTIAFVAACEINGDEGEYYSFTPNTTITATEAGWDVAIGNVDGETGGSLTLTSDIPAGFTLDVELEDAGELGGSFMFTGDVAGTLLANLVELAVDDNIEVSGTVQADAFVSIDNEVTLSGTGKVITMTDPDELTGMILDGDRNEVVPTGNDPEEGWYTYALAAEPETYEVTVAEPVEHCTVKVEISGREPAYKGGKYKAPIDATVVVTYKPDEDYEITDGQAVWTFTAESDVFVTTAPSVAQSAPAVAVATVTLAGGQPVEYTDLHAALVAGSAAGSLVELIDNVDLAGKNWQPINDFYGKFDGKGFIISNLTISASVNNLGLFGSWAWAFDHAGICNFTIENVSITAPSSQNVGAVAGKNGSDDGIAISNVTVCGLIQIDAAKYVGGICGHNAYNKIIDCHVNGSEGSFIGNASGTQIGGIAGSSGEGTMLIANSSVSGVTIVASKQAGGIQGRLFYGNRVIGCSTEDVTLEVAGTTAGSIAGQIQLDPSGAGEIHYVLNCTTDDEINPLVGSDTDYPIVRTVIGEGFEGDFGSFTAGTFMADAAALADVTAKCAAGYEPVANQDGTYTITQVYPITVVNAGEKATVAIDQTGSVLPGAKITGTISDVTEGFKAFVFVDGVKVAVDNEGKFEGTATASAKITVAYAKDSAWYLDPFVKNDVNLAHTSSGRVGVPTLNGDGTHLLMADDWNNINAAYNTVSFYLLGTTAYDQLIGSYLGTPINSVSIVGGEQALGVVDNNFEGFNGYVECGDFILAATSQGSCHGGVPVVMPVEGAWGGYTNGMVEKTVTLNPGDRYYPVKFDINNGSMPGAKGASWPDGLQWFTRAVASTDKQSIYFGIYARNEITKATVSKDANGKVSIVKSGTFWRTWNDQAVHASHAANALALFNDGTKDIVLAALADGRLVKLDEETLSGNTYTNCYSIEKSEPAYVQDHKMIELAATGFACNTMYITGVADDTPHLVCQFTDGNTKVYALTATGDLVSTEPIADIAATAYGAPKCWASLAAQDDELVAYGAYNATGNYSHLATITAKPAQVTIRTTFGTYEEGTDTMVDYGTDAKVAIAPAAGYMITSVKVNGEPLLGFNPAGFDFEEADIARNVYIEMTQEKAPFIILIGSDGTEKARYADLNEAFAAAAEGDTVKLLQNAMVADPITVTDFKGTFDLGGFSVGTTFTTDAYIAFNGACDAVITNGTMATGEEIDVSGTSIVTIAANTTLNNAGRYGVYVYGTATLNIYGTINNTTGEMPCVWMGGSSTVNAYEGCVVNSTGDAFRINGSGRTLNIYGGTFHGGYPIAYVYNENTSAINIYGGTFDSDNGFVGGGAKETVVVAPLTDACTAKFSQLAPTSWFLGLDHYCASGYAPVKEGDWYVVKQTYTVTLKNGDAVVDTQVVADGQFATNVVLDVEGFKGWTNENYTAAFDFANTAITADITLFAWIEAVGPVYPQDLPEEFPADADQAVKDKYVDWAKAYNVTDATGLSDAFLMNVDPNGTIPTLKIESIAVEGDTATIVVSAEGVNLETGINGVLYVDGTNELGAEWATTEVEIGSAAQFNEGKATFTVPNAKFMKAGVGFKAPTVVPVTD